jgi:hypothetical protein
MIFIYIANIIVAGWISVTSLFFPKKAVSTVFSDSLVYSEAIRLIGALWFAIFILSVLGLFFPEKMSLVLLFQLIYKSTWLLFVALRALITKNPFPVYMAIFFVVWVIVLPFVIPWNQIFG